jgi:hypothetical protein
MYEAIGRLGRGQIPSGLRVGTICFELGCVPLGAVRPLAWGEEFAYRPGRTLVHRHCSKETVAPERLAMFVHKYHTSIAIDGSRE